MRLDKAASSDTRISPCVPACNKALSKRCLRLVCSRSFFCRLPSLNGKADSMLTCSAKEELLTIF